MGKNKLLLKKHKKYKLTINKNYKQKYGFKTKSTYIFKTPKGLSTDVVRQISDIKDEPSWMLELRLNALEIFNKLPIPEWGPDLSKIDFNNIYYYLKPAHKAQKSWNKVPPEMKTTFEKLGIPKAEREYLAGVKAQFDSEVIYDSLRKEIEQEGIIFMSTDDALKKHPQMFKKYFGKLVSASDNKFSALNSAVWSGGSFVYIPKNISVSRPLQAYFRINAQNIGQFERTLIIADESSCANYVEGCTAPVYSSDALHAAVVEVFVHKDAHFRYTTIQNWSSDVYNLVTKRSRLDKNAVMEWVDGNLGSKITMKYPSCYLVGDRSHGEVLSIAYAGKNMHQDAGAKMIHIGRNTTSKIISKSISTHGGRASYRGLVSISPSAYDSKSRVECDALILDKYSASDTYPTIDIHNNSALTEHEATVSKISEEKLFYLTSRGLDEAQAMSLIISGFIEPIVSKLPLEYAVELNRLIELEMEGSIG